MKVSEVMHTPAVVCRPGTTAGQAARIMADRNVGSVLVVDNVGEIAGIVTDRDIALRGVARGRSADIPVEELMTRDVASVDPRADVASAAATMIKRRVRRVPVVDEMGHAHGLVAYDDILRTLWRQGDELADVLRDQMAER